MLTRKAEKAGGGFSDINTWTAKLSQFAHCCGSYRKKKLSERVHECCGIRVQRDLYSAFLALCYDEAKEVVDAEMARKLFPSVRLTLNQAHRQALYQAASSGRKTASFGPAIAGHEAELLV